jgi:uncharacterized protein
MPSSMTGLETFTLSDNRDDPREDDDEVVDKRDVRDADSFFNLPDDNGSDEDEDEDEDKDDARSKR